MSIKLSKNLKFIKNIKKFDLLCAGFLFVIAAPSCALAYLDPGTGNILIYIAISLFGALAYSLKGLFYRISGGKYEQSGEASKANIAIFSEGKNYWYTFRPVIMALIEKKCPFYYFSMDIDDIGLTIEDEHMISRYIGTGSAAFAKLSGVRASVMLATTPNIGSPGFPMPRPPHIKTLAHVFHAADDIALYKKGSLDNYDAALLVGEFMASSIRELEALRGLPQKELVLAGLPYLDEMAEKTKIYKKDEKKGKKEKSGKSDKKTVLIAPSWGTKGCLSAYGSGFIKDLVTAGFHVILRPHPHSWRVEKPLMEKIKKELDGLPVVFDREIDGSASMFSSDILISDTSAVRMDYFLLHEKPVITLETPLEDAHTFEISDMQEAWMDTVVNEMGLLIKKEDIGSIAKAVEKTMSEHKGKDRGAFREKHVCNFGRSGEVIADYLIKKAGEHHAI